MPGTKKLLHFMVEEHVTACGRVFKHRRPDVPLDRVTCPDCRLRVDRPISAGLVHFSEESEDSRGRRKVGAACSAADPENLTQNGLEVTCERCKSAILLDATYLREQVKDGDRSIRELKAELEKAYEAVRLMRNDVGKMEKEIGAFNLVDKRIVALLAGGSIVESQPCSMCLGTGKVASLLLGPGEEPKPCPSIGCREGRVEVRRWRFERP